MDVVRIRGDELVVEVPSKGELDSMSEEAVVEQANCELVGGTGQGGGEPC